MPTVQVPMHFYEQSSSAGVEKLDIGLKECICTPSAAIYVLTFRNVSDSK